MSTYQPLTTVEVEGETNSNRPYDPHIPAASAPPPFNPAAEGATHLEPTPVSHLHVPRLQVDHNNQLKIETRPSWIMKLFMCPFPFCGMGCCISQSTDLVFDDHMRTLSIRSWRGYCFCCEKDRADIPYDQIANFVAIPADLKINDQVSYIINVVTKDGKRIRISDPALPKSLALDLLAYHRFMFGRARPETYVQPTFDSLISI